MAKNRKNQAAAIRFAPALKASFLCLLIGGSAVGYVWQKNEIYRLAEQRRQREIKLKQMVVDNQQLTVQLDTLHSSVMLDRRVKELQLGLVPATPMQVVRLTELSVAPDKANSRQFASRPGSNLAP